MTQISLDVNYIDKLSYSLFRSIKIRAREINWKRLLVEKNTLLFKSIKNSPLEGLNVFYFYLKYTSRKGEEDLCNRSNQN